MSDSKKLKSGESFQYVDNEEEISEVSMDESMELDPMEFLDDKCIDSVCMRQQRYKILSAQEVFETMMEIVDEAKEVIDLPTPTVMVLLNHVKWDKDSLFDVYFENKEKLLMLANVLIPSQTPTEPNAGDGEFDCDICFDTVSFENSSKMKCNHRFCKNCWTSYLQEQVMEKGMSLQIPCPASECPIFVEYEVVTAHVSDKIVMTKYHQLITQDFVKSNRLFRWCPGVGCDKAICVEFVDWIGVKCSCGITFCYLCGKDWHEPIKCDTLDRWLRIDSKGFAETLAWMQTNTKDCPNCKTMIEKNGGCNKVTCRSCGQAFCWMCNKSWNSDNHYYCNRYLGATEDEANGIRKSLKRFNHYSDRYNCQLNSLKFENEIMEKANARKMRFQKRTTLFWGEGQFFVDAAETLCRCRKTLMYSYGFAYFLPKSNQAEIFEDNQSDLQVATETLSWDLEHEFPEDENTIVDPKTVKAKIMHGTSYCESRRIILVKHVLEGYENKYWDEPPPPPPSVNSGFQCSIM